MQVKKHDVRQMMIDIDKLEAATVTFDDFVEMVTPRITGRDTREEIMKVHKPAVERHPFRQLFLCLIN